MTSAIEIKGLSKTFRSEFLQKEKKVLSNLNLSVESGTIFGFLGPNGAGKTTTIKLLTGLIHPTSGTAFIFGKSIREIVSREKMGFLPERPYFYEYLTGLEFLNFCGELFGLSRSSRDKKIDELLELVDLKGSEKMQMRQYSKGMLQRIGLAQALFNDPELVIMDEPMSGLDPVGRKEVRDIILHLKDEGKTVFFSTHILSDAELICDEVAILIGGTLRNQGKLEDFLNPKVKSIEVCLRGVSKEQLSQIKPMLSSMTFHDERILVCLDREERLEKLLAWVAQEKAQVISITPRKETLEDLFLEEYKVGVKA
ncbi:MAG: ABC transporter ATP-binding protein [Nitrospirae bacterium]|nr:ABC transporter ATP-binding protein [Candidatus Manganitrophaceae bacterium]